MFCIRCGHLNAPPVPKQCGKCSAILPRMAWSDATDATSTLELEEGRAYVVPQRSFPTEYLYNLTCRAYEYLYEGEPGDGLLEAYQVVRSRVEAFDSEALPILLQRMRQEQRTAPDDDYYSQMTYLLNRGVTIMQEGFALMDAFVASGEGETLRAAVLKMQEGNDNLALGKEMSLARLRGESLPIGGGAPSPAENTADDRGESPAEEGGKPGPEPQAESPAPAAPPSQLPRRPSIRPNSIRPR